MDAPQELQPLLVKAVHVSREGELFKVQVEVMGGQRVTMHFGMVGMWALTQGLGDAVEAANQERARAHRQLAQPALIEHACIEPDCRNYVVNEGARCKRCAATQRWVDRKQGQEVV